MMYKIKKESMLWNEFLGSQSFEFIKPYFRNLGARNILITDIWEGEFEPIEEKEYTGGDMIDFLNYSLNNGMNLCDAWGKDLLVCFNKWKKQRK